MTPVHLQPASSAWSRKIRARDDAKHSVSGGRDGRGGRVGPRAAPPPARLSARGAGPDVTLVRAAAHGRPDALIPALRGRRAPGSSGRWRGEGGGVGRRAASGAGGTGLRRRGVFRRSAAVCIIFHSFLANLNILQAEGSRQVRASCSSPRSPRALGALSEDRPHEEPESFGVLFSYADVFLKLEVFFFFLSFRVSTALKESTLGKGRRRKLSNILVGGGIFKGKKFECIATEKMSRPLPLNPTFIPPPYGVLRSLLENPLKLPLHHEDGERCPPGCPALGREDAPGVPFLGRAPPLACRSIHLPPSLSPGTLALL